jgi:hypothetical protein
MNLISSLRSSLLPSLQELSLLALSVHPLSFTALHRKTVIKKSTYNIHISLNAICQ